MSDRKRTPGAVTPGTIVHQGARDLHPELAPEYTLSGVQQIGGGLLGMLEHTIAVQMAAGDITMAKEYFVKLAEMAEFMKEVAFSKLKPDDFVAFSSVSGDKEDDGQPWLTAAAAERVGATCGVDFGIVGNAFQDIQGEDTEGPWFIRRVHMWFKWGTQYKEAVGESWSRDGMFSSGGKLTASQVPRTKIGTKAQSRAKQIGIGTVLGLRSLTWERVRELMGDKAVGPKDVKKAKFEKGGQGGGGKQQAKEGFAPKAQIGRVYDAWCRAAGMSNDRDQWDKNKGPFWAFVAPIIGADPKKPKRWDSYTQAEIDTLLAAINEIPR
jgi:hypothetical protein